MARVPDAELKREVSVQGLAEARGIKIARHGAELIGLYPFHEDKKTPVSGRSLVAGFDLSIHGRS